MEKSEIQYPVSGLKMPSCRNSGKLHKYEGQIDFAFFNIRWHEHYWKGSAHTSEALREVEKNLSRLRLLLNE